MLVRPLDNYLGDNTIKSRSPIKCTTKLKCGQQFHWKKNYFFEAKRCSMNRINFDKLHATKKW